MKPHLYILVTLLVGGCNAFDPQLDDVSFTCEADDPICPDGYNAVITGSKCECRNDGSDPGDDVDDVFLPDASPDPAQCAADPDNGTPGKATGTAVGAGASTYFAATSVCNPADIDYYRVQLSADRLSLDASLTFDTAAGVLSLSITDVDGNELVLGTGQTNRRVATYTASAPSTVLVKVATGGGISAYEIDLKSR
jgi:hypothetical protein